MGVTLNLMQTEIVKVRNHTDKSGVYHTEKSGVYYNQAKVEQNIIMSRTIPEMH